MHINAVRSKYRIVVIIWEFTDREFEHNLLLN